MLGNISVLFFPPCQKLSATCSQPNESKSNPVGSDPSSDPTRNPYLARRDPELGVVELKRRGGHVHAEERRGIPKADPDRRVDR